THPFAHSQPVAGLHVAGHAGTSCQCPGRYGAGAGALTGPAVGRIRLCLAGYPTHSGGVARECAAGLSASDYPYPNRTSGSERAGAYGAHIENGDALAESSAALYRGANLI